jgi:3-oxoacyl-[acyl-carrier protein] reductase
MLIVHGLTGGVGGELMRLAYGNYKDFSTLYGATRDDCDLTKPDELDRFYGNLKNIDAAFATEPLYVINATGACENSLVVKTGTESYRRQVSTTVDGTFFLTRAFAQATQDRPGSSLLHLSSVVARKRLAGTAVYSMAKGAMAGLVQSAAAELGRNGSRINAIEMGYFDTGMIRLVPGSILGSIIQETPLKRLGKVEELWTICSEVLRNSFVTGAVIPITGGL